MGRRKFMMAKARVTEEGGRKVAGFGIYLEVEPRDLLIDWTLTKGGVGAFG